MDTKILGMWFHTALEIFRAYNRQANACHWAERDKEHLKISGVEEMSRPPTA